MKKTLKRYSHEMAQNVIAVQSYPDSKSSVSENKLHRVTESRSVILDPSSTGAGCNCV